MSEGYIQPQRPDWAPLRLRHRGVDMRFEMVAPNTGDAIYTGTRKGERVSVLLVKP